MQKTITQQEIKDFIEKTTDCAHDLRNIARLVEKGKVDDLDTVWSQVGALQNIISAAAELTGALVIAEQVQRQKADLRKLKEDK